MNKRIRKKHKPRFNLGLLYLSNFRKLENIIGHEIDHKIKRSMQNNIKREYRKEPKNSRMIEITRDVLERIMFASIEQSFYPMDYFENKSMEVSLNEQTNQEKENHSEKEA